MLKKEWDYNMNPYVKEFLKRGLMFSGLGPIVAGITYLIIDLTGTDLKLSGGDILLAIITTYVIAFVQAGSSVFNQVETWGPAKVLIFQLSSIYLVYTVGYLINRWIPLDYKVILIYTGIFIGAYLVIWFSIYFTVKKKTEKLNEKLKQQQESIE